MKIVVCIRRGRDGEINPFDACAYEAALNIPDAEIILLSMGVASTGPFLLELTRLGATKAVLLTDKMFVGSDTLATAYVLSKAMEKIKPDLVICGRQTLEGDTAQTGPMLATLCGYFLVTNVMQLHCVDERVICNTRAEGEQAATYPALITVERYNQLRFPSIRSKCGTLEIWDANELHVEAERCGLSGSPTRVLEITEKHSGKRKCKFSELNKLNEIVKNCFKLSKPSQDDPAETGNKLEKVFVVGKQVLPFAKMISDDITVLDRNEAIHIADIIVRENPSAVLWGSDSWSKRVSAQVAALLKLGLCADCTSLETDGETLFMHRPALAGSVMAKVKCLTRPAMATVRTIEEGGQNIVIAVGYGACKYVEKLEHIAKEYSVQMVTTRKMVNNGFLPYEKQVGLTGKRISPNIYIAIGVSGAVHHLVGMEQANVVIAINSDKNAPIFEYADYGVVASVEEVLEEYERNSN